MYDHIISRLKDVKHVPQRQMWRCCCPVIANHRNGDKNQSAAVFVSSRTNDLIFRCFKGCTALQAADAIGVPIKLWCAQQKGKEVRMTTEKADKYYYRDALGKLALRVIRRQNKSFLQQRPIFDPETGNVIGFTDSLAPGIYRSVPPKHTQFTLLQDNEEVTDCKVQKLPEFEPIPYNLNLITKFPDHIVFVVEGERKADLMYQMGFLATCNNGGACNWTKTQSQWLTNREVIILPDYDAMGTKHAQLVAGSLIDNGVLSVSILRLEKIDRHAWQDKDDIIDAVRRAGRETIQQLILNSTHKPAYIGTQDIDAEYARRATWVDLSGGTHDE
jgi:hypothetical protein